MNKQIEQALKHLDYADSLLDARMYAQAQDEIQACKEALKQPVQEPVAWIVGNHGHCTTKKDWAEKYSNHIIPLYTHQAPSWQGLSDDEIANCTLDKLADDYDIKFARAIEQTLKEKNNG